MKSDVRIAHYIFHPVGPILLYLFMAITTLHMLIPLLLSIHIETVTFIASLFCCMIYVLTEANHKAETYHPVVFPLILGLLFIVSPLFTSLMNQDYLLILKDGEFKDLFKMILFGPFLYFMMSKKSYKEIILNCINLFYFIFALYFLYRFLILNEVREFDQRPLLKIRHGDANFLCTFFSMMIPLPLMLAFEAFNKKKKRHMLLYLFCSFLFLLCALLTESRMGLIAIAFGLLYLVTLKKLAFPKMLIVSIFIFCSSAFVAFNGERLLSRYAEIQDKSNTDRYLSWVNGWKIFIDNPIAGVGMHKSKNFFYQNTQYPAFQSEFSPLEVHNTFLKIGAELGLIGLMSFLLLYLWVWRNIFKMNSTRKYFLLSSIGILTLSIMTIGLAYKDLFVLHLFVLAALAHKGVESYE